MPRVPTYDNLQTGVSPGNGPSLSGPTPGEIGAQQAQMLARGVGAAGEAMQRMALDQLAMANEVKVSDAMNKAVQAKLRLTYDPENGYTHLRGDAALTRPDGQALGDEYGGKLADAMAQIESGLGNEAQRAAFRQQAGQLAVQFRGQVDGHMAREFGAHRESVADGTIGTGQLQAQLAWDDPGQVAQAVGAIKAGVYAKGQAKGWSARETELATLEALSPAHAGVLRAAVDAQKLDYAREYLKQYGAELTPAARLQMKGLLDEGDFEQRAQDATDKLWAKHEGNAAAALVDARASLTGKDEDAVVQRLKVLDAERTQLRERAQRDAADTAWQYAASGRSPPLSVVQQMDGRDAMALRKAMTTAAEGKAIKTDMEAYAQLTQAAVQNPQGFAQLDLRRYADKLSAADMRHFIGEQADAAKPDKLPDMVTAGQQKSTMLEVLGLKGKDAGQFSQLADRALTAAQGVKGKALTAAERQQVLDGLVIEGTTPGSLWGSNATRRYQAAAAGKPFTPTFDAQQIARAKAALQRRGIANPSAEQIDQTLRLTYGID